jgi:hypothetical protein
MKLKSAGFAWEQARGQLRDSRKSDGGVRTGSVVLRLPNQHAWGLGQIFGRTVSRTDEPQPDGLVPSRVDVRVAP